MQCAEALEDILREQGPDRVAAVMIEPVSGSTGGALVPPNGYLERLSEICRANGILLIADETVTAFGRTGTPFAMRHPLVDIAIGGKCLGGGFAAINAVIVSGDLAEEITAGADELPLRLTFNGNPLACIAALSVQDYAREQALWQRVQGHSSVIDSELRRLCSKNCPTALVSGVGHLWALQLPVRVGDGLSVLERLRTAASRRGIELMGGILTGRERDYAHIMFTPAFDVTDSELQEGIEAAVRLIADAAQPRT